MGVDISMISGAIQYGEPARSGLSSVPLLGAPSEFIFIATPKSASFTMLCLRWHTCEKEVHYVLKQKFSSLCIMQMKYSNKK